MFESVLCFNGNLKLRLYQNRDFETRSNTTFNLHMSKSKYFQWDENIDRSYVTTVRQGRNASTICFKIAVETNAYEKSFDPLRT